MSDGTLATAGMKVGDPLPELAIDITTVGLKGFGQTGPILAVPAVSDSPVSTATAVKSPSTRICMVLPSRVQGRSVLYVRLSTPGQFSKP